MKKLQMEGDTVMALNLTTNVAWSILVVAGLFEIVWATGLKYAEGFTRLWASVITLAAMALSFLLLSQAVRSLPIGTAYAVWVGVGAMGTALTGILLFHEPATFARLFCIVLIVTGVVGLRLVSSV